MTEFEMQRDLRAMNAPRDPGRDLFPSIAARIAAESGAPVATPVRRRRWMPLAAAAGTLFAIVGGVTLFALQSKTAAPDDGYGVAHVDRISPREAREQALRSGIDPRIAGANVVLDAAHSELQQALEQHPDAVFLVSLLNRTNAQRLKLEQLGANAG
jgi:hypothetical protein